MTALPEPVAADIVALLDECSRACQLLAEEEGPYRRGEQPRRRDITEGRPGSPLRLGLRLRTAEGSPVVGADVEVWHCDADGRYSGYPANDPDVAVDPSPQQADHLPAETFLRGRQTTDESGDVEFHTVHPGWYQGRAVHIHLVVHAGASSCTTQLYFPEDVTAEVFAQDPYRSHGLPDTTHATDGIYPTGGLPAVLEMHARCDGHVAVTCLVLPEDDQRRS